MKIGLVLEGGAMRGIYTIGVLDTLMENHIKFDGIMGVSAGALFGVNYKSKQKDRALRYNKKFANDKRYMGIYSLITTGNIVNKDFCFNKLVNELDTFDFETFKKSQEKFYVVVTNVKTGKPEYIEIKDLKNHNELEYLRVSGSMPFVSKTVKIDENEYLDGGTSDSIPIDKMIEMGYDKIIVVLTRPIEYRKKKVNSTFAKIYYRKYPSLVETINNRYLKYNEQVERIISLEKEGKILVIRPSKLVKIKRLEKDINVIQEMYDLGRNDASNLLKSINEYLLDKK